MNIRKEIQLLTLVALPIGYLIYMWSSLPDQIPMHWNINGEIDRWGSKTELLILVVLLPSITYLILKTVPFFDPQNKIKLMGNKYFQLNVILLLFTSIFSIYMVYLSVNPTSDLNLILVVFGLLIAISGNYFKTVRPNYFIGIRTPWTLKNEMVWKKTHRMGGRLWLAGGLLLVICCLWFPASWTIPVSIGLIMTISLIPIIYSYVTYRSIQDM